MGRALFRSHSFSIDLEVLILTKSWVYRDSFHWKAHFPNLHTLGIFDLNSDVGDHTRTIAGGLADWKLPALRRLIINASSLDGVALLVLYQKFGSKLVSLDIESSMSFEPIPNMLAMFPELRELVASCVLVDGTLEAQPPHLAEMYLRLLPSDDNSHSFAKHSQSEYVQFIIENFIHCMNALHRTCSPALADIRFIDFDVSQFQETFRPSHLSTWKEWVEKWSEVNVRFEDKFGKLIEIPRWIDKASEEFKSGKLVEEDCLVLGEYGSEDWE
jgi:hypothetical protein